MRRRLALALFALMLLATSVSASFWNKLAETMMESIIPWAVNLILYPFMSLSLLSIKELLYFNPTFLCFDPGCTPTRGVGVLQQYIMYILVPFYIVAMMFTALFLITKAGSPRGRSRAKNMFFRLVIGMLFVIYAPFIYQTMLEVSALITKSFLAKVDINEVMAFAGFGKAVSMCCLQFCMFLVLLMTVLVLLFRWFSVYMYGVFFPLIMFLYFFEITKPYGSKYFKQAVRWVFVPPLQALILYVMVAGPMRTMGMVTAAGLPAELQMIFTQFITVFVVLSGMATMCAAPMMMTHILRFMGKSIYAFGLVVDSLPLMSIGGVIAGEGPAAFATAHGHFSRLRAYEASQSASFGGGIAKQAPKATRMVGSQTGAVDRHGGADYGSEAGGGGGFMEEAAAARRGMPSMPSMGSELGGIRKTAGEERSEGVEEKSETAGMEGEPADTLSTADISAAREEAATGLNPDDIKHELEEVKGMAGESPYEYLQGRRGVATPVAGFRSATTASQAETMGGIERSIGNLASAGVSEDDLRPFRSMLSDMREIHRNTTFTRKPGEVREGDLTVKSDMDSRQKSLDNNAAKARDKITMLQKQHYDREAVRSEIAYLQRMVGHETEAGEKQKGNKDKGGRR